MPENRPVKFGEAFGIMVVVFFMGVIAASFLGLLAAIAFQTFRWFTG